MKNDDNKILQQTKYLSILILFIQVYAMGLVIKCGKRKKLRFVTKSMLLKDISENYKASNSNL